MNEDENFLGSAFHLLCRTRRIVVIVQVPKVWEKYTLEAKMYTSPRKSVSQLRV